MRLCISSSLASLSASLCIHVEASIGVRVNDINSENAVAHATVTPNCLKNWPTIPPINAIGRNTTMSTIVIVIAASPISDRPLRAASSGCSRIRRWRSMFSRTTIESSTRIPTTSDNASSTIWFCVKPNPLMGMNVAMSEVGIATATMNVALAVCRNRKTIRTTSSMPSKRLWFTSFRASLTNFDWSIAMTGWTPIGSSRLQVGELFLDPFGDLDGIGVGLLLDVEDDRRLAVETGDGSPARRRCP